MEIRAINTVEYRLQTNILVKRFNRTLVSQLQNYVFQHPRDWDKFFLLTYTYNVQVRRLTNL